jgi:hypothetical protein
LFFEEAQLLQSTLAAALLFGRAGRDRRRGFLRGWGLGGETNATDVEVFLEAIDLEEIG